MLARGFSIISLYMRFPISFLSRIHTFDYIITTTKTKNEEHKEGEETFLK